MYGLEVGYRRDRPGPSDLIIYRKQAGEGLLGLELVRDGPAGELGGIAEGLLNGGFVDLDDDSVGGVGERLASGVPLRYVILDLGYCLADFPFVGYRKAPGRRHGKGVVMGVSLNRISGNMVEGAVESPPSDFLAVQKLEGSAGGVAGIGERLLADFFPFFVQGPE